MFSNVKNKVCEFSKGIQGKYQSSKNIVKNFINDENGQGLIEYIILAVLLVIGCIVAVRVVGKNITGKFKKVDSELQKGQ